MEVTFTQEQRMTASSYLTAKECEVLKWQLQQAMEEKVSTVFLPEKAPFSFS